MWSDAAFGLRTLKSQPGFTVVAVLSLALGIGLNTAIFTVVDAVLFRPLPVSEPDELAAVYTTSDNEGVEFGTSSYQDMRDIIEQNTVFSDVIGRSMMFTSLSGAGGNRMTFGEVVTANYFDALGVRPPIGRGFRPEEESGEGAHPVAVISDRLWQRGFGGRADIVGQTLLIKNRPYSVIGVAPPDFPGMIPGVATELWVPISMVEDVEPVGLNDSVPSATGTTRLERRGMRWLFVMGRLRPGVSVEAAEANVAAVMARLGQTYPISNDGRRARVVPAADVRIHPMIDGALRPTGFVLLAAVGLVLLVACANLASMLLAKGVSRSKEFALRASLGASRWRLVRQLVVENVALAMAGGAAGLAIATWAIRLAASFQLPFEMPLALTFGVDGRVLLFALVLSMLTGIAFSVLPALQSSKTNLVTSLKTDAPLSGAGGRLRLGPALVVVQVAVSIVLLVGGVLLMRSLSAAQRIDPGFAAAELAVATIGLDFHGYSTEQAMDFYQRARVRVGALPGVTGVAVTQRMPISPNISRSTIVVDGRPDRTPAGGLAIDSTYVSEGYFETLGVPVDEGRAFDTRDTGDAQRVAVVNRELARRLWPGEAAVGRRLRLRDQDGPLVEVVGVAATHKVNTLGEPALPLIHFARSQNPTAYGTIVARTTGDVNALARDMARELYAMEPTLVLIEANPFTRVIGVSLLPVRFGAALIAGLAGLAMLLAGLGLYGTIAFGVSRRRREIGIRMALGADRRRVVRQVLREGAALVGLGSVLGLAAAIAGARALTAVLYGVTALDPASYAAAVGLLGLTALIAAGIPARRAASVDPLVALRH